MRRSFGVFSVIVLTVGTGYGFSPYFMFETAGRDCYADGTPLLAGERYALVWRSKDSLDRTDGLLGADGRSVDTNCCEVLWLFDAAERRTDAGTGEVYAAARRSYVQIAESYLSKRGDTGVYSLFVFDTRVWEGDGWSPSSKTSNTSVSVLNGYGLVTDLEVISTSKTGTDPGFFVWMRPNADFLSDDALVSHGDRTTGLSQTSNPTVLPCPAPYPAFAAIACEKGVVTVSATNGSPYVAYGLDRAESPAQLSIQTNIVAISQGAGAEPMIWQVPVGATTNGFFRIRPLR